MNHCFKRWQQQKVQSVAYAGDGTSCRDEKMFDDNQDGDIQSDSWLTVHQYASVDVVQDLSGTGRSRGRSRIYKAAQSDSSGFSGVG